MHYQLWFRFVLDRYSIFASDYLTLTQVSSHRLTRALVRSRYLTWDMVVLKVMVSSCGIHLPVFCHTLAEFWASELVVNELGSYPCAHNMGGRVGECRQYGALMGSRPDSPVLDAGGMQRVFVLPGLVATCISFPCFAIFVF